MRRLNDNWVNSEPFDHLLKIEADTILPRYYIEILSEIMNRMPKLGVAAGRIEGETGSDTPNGNRKDGEMECNQGYGWKILGP